MPYLSLRIFRTGTIALVVHDAAEIILSASVKDLSLTPKTMFLISPFAGAVKITFEAQESRCCDKSVSSLHIPVLSITIGLIIPSFS